MQGGNNGGVRIVTDSAGDLPRELAAKYGIITVPIRVNIGGASYQDGVDFPTRIASVSGSDSALSTSQPSPWDFHRIFSDLTAQGEAVLCLTLSKKLSGTFQSAVIAAGQVGGNIRVVDSKLVSVGQGLLALQLAQAAAVNAVEELVKLAKSTRENIRGYAALDSVEPIVRGGRTSLFARHAAGQAGVKLIFSINLQGEIQILHRVRGRKPSLDRLIKLIEAGGYERAAVAHVGCSSEAALVARGIQERGQTKVLYVQEASGAVRAYAGPGAIIVAGMTHS